MASDTIENYLKAIFSLIDESGEVATTDIAHQLGVSLPTVNSMVKKLDEMGLLKYEKYKPLVMTTKGRKAAALIVRKHRLTEMYLVEKMGFGWEEVHGIAEQIEHIDSQLFFERMDELLGFPQFDPHGSPIPDKDGKIPHLRLKKLSECKPGRMVILKALDHSSDDFLHYLNSKSIALGMKIDLLKLELFDRSFTVAYDGHPQEVLSEKVCEKLLVE